MVAAEQHRATRLGNPATRFAPPISTASDLRARFEDPRLRPDFAEVLRQWGWQGKVEDLFAAAASADIIEWRIPVGEIMPFMSSREDGRAICLRNVEWAGEEPISALAFTFTSNGRVYRCITPRPCSNFFVVDLGPEPKVALNIECSAPEKVVASRPIEVCLIVSNTGNTSAAPVTAMLPLPAGVTVAAATGGYTLTNGELRWTIDSLASNAGQKLCARFKTEKPGQVSFSPSAKYAKLPAVLSACATEVIGLPAILLEKADDPDPVPVGETTTYTVKVTNQGTADDANVQIVVEIAPELEPVSTTEGTIDGQKVTLPLVAKLAAKEAVSYKIVAKGVRAGDGHTKFVLSSDMLKSPISAEESTTVY